MAPPTEAEKIRVTGHVQDLLRTPAFAGTRRCRDFLQYVVEETLSGRGPSIKERNIAIDVFSKGADFDSQTESIVRVNAAELRRRLALAYDSCGDSAVRIDLPVGSYQPVFHLRGEVKAEVSAPPQVSKVARRHAVTAAVVGLVAIAGWALWYGAYARPQSAMDLLWQPFTGSTNPVLISLPAPMVLQSSQMENSFAFQPGGFIPNSKLRAMDTYYVGTGAAYGAARFAEQLAMRHQSFLVKFGRDVAFSDLNNSPALLLGAYSSFWTMELLKPLRFRFEANDEWKSIVDSAHPERPWRVPILHESVEPREGYALVTRLLKSESGWPLLIAAGMSARDTQGAVEFLTGPGSFENFAKGLPTDWPRRNLQVVLHCYTHGHSPGSPAVVAWHVW